MVNLRAGDKMPRNEACMICQIGLSFGDTKGDLASRDDGPSQEEGLLLLRAFMNIKHATLREAIINIVSALSCPDGGS